MSDSGDFTGPVITALVFSGLSLAAALAALGWQIAAFVLSGGRVKVKLRLAEIVPYAGTYAIRIDERGVRRTVPADHPDLGRPGIGMEVAHVIVENPGRLAVTITDVGLSFDWGQQGIYRVGPRAFPIKDHGAYDSDGKTYTRLEPFSRVSFCFDFWPLVEERRSDSGERPIRVRAYATVAGKVEKSSRNAAWVFQPGDVTSREEPNKISVGDVILRTMMREQWGEEPSEGPDSPMAYKVAMKLTSDSDVDEIKEAIREVGRSLWRDPNSPAAYLAYLIRQQLDRYGDQLLWPDGGANDTVRLD